MSVNNIIQKQSRIVNIAAVLVIVACLKYASPIILPLLLALFLSIICAYPILWLQKKKVPRGLAIIIVLSAVVFILFLITEVIATSLNGFSERIPFYEEKIGAILKEVNRDLQFLDLGLSFDKLIGSVDTGRVFQFSSILLSQLGSLMSNSFLILLVTVFLLDEMKTFYLKFDLLQNRYGIELGYLKEVGQRIRHYLSLKTAVSLITGFAIYLWLEILGMEYAILWGVIAFLLNYIPNIGSIIAAAPTLLMAAIDLGWGGFIWTGIAYFTVNVVMGNIVEPKIMGRGLGLSTLVVFLSLIVWGYIFGTVGMFLSVPITISIKIMLEKHKKTEWIALLLTSEREIDKLNKTN